MANCESVDEVEPQSAKWKVYTQVSEGGAISQGEKIHGETRDFERGGGGGEMRTPIRSDKMIVRLSTKYLPVSRV